MQMPAVTDLQLLVAVAEHGGVGAGARELGLAQPNASRALRRLERQLRVKLLRRAARGSTMTPEGALVVDWAKRVLEANARLIAGVESLAGDRQPTISVVASQTIAEDLLPRWLAALSEAHPGVKVTLAVGNSAEVGRRVSNGAAVGFLESPDLPHTLRGEFGTELISTDRLVVVVSPAHPWARRTRPISLDEFTRTRLVVREPGSGTRVSLEQALAHVSLAPPALELDGNAAVRVAVAAGAGPAVLSEHAVQQAVAAGDLRAVMVDELLIERPLRAVWSLGRDLPPAARDLIDLATRIERERYEAGRAPASPEIDLGWGL